MIQRENNPNYLNSFLDYSITILNKSPNSVKEYNYDLAMFLRFIKVHFKLTDKKQLNEINYDDVTIETIRKIKLDDIHSFLSYLAFESKASSATRARKASTIRIFFKYLSQKTDLLEVNPAQNLETPKIGKRMPKYLSLDDSMKLLDIAGDEDARHPERDYAIITLFLNCGMRLSELVNIKITDINFSDCKLNVIGKGNKERTIYLNKACVKAINEYLLVRPKNGIKSDSQDYLFISDRKSKISNRTVQHIVKQELRKAGLDTTKYSAHKLRHTAATLMYQYGNVDIRALQELLRTCKHFYYRNIHTR